MIRIACLKDLYKDKTITSIKNDNEADVRLLKIDLIALPLSRFVIPVPRRVQMRK